MKSKKKKNSEHGKNRKSEAANVKNTERREKGTL